MFKTDIISDEFPMFSSRHFKDLDSHVNTPYMYNNKGRQ